ncbi:MAG: helix-turn-helix transcriptional regulator [Acidobacteria bacterium]|nr:helix-turn-helix transcriptional regulator [Acidobacteriota bacterium]
MQNWTESSVDDFLYRLGSDFVRQMEQAMAAKKTNQAGLAKTLGVSEGRVSQMLNNPGNLTLRKMIEYSRALQRKVSVIAYDDNDPKNLRGPINAEIFTSCWEMAGKPADAFELPIPHTSVIRSEATGADLHYLDHPGGLQDTAETPSTSGAPIGGLNG